MRFISIQKFNLRETPKVFIGLFILISILIALSLILKSYASVSLINSNKYIEVTNLDKGTTQLLPEKSSETKSIYDNAKVAFTKQEADSKRVVGRKNESFNSHGLSYRKATSLFSPSVSIIAPTNNQVFTVPVNITLTASASDPNSTINRVEFYAGNIFLGSSTTLDPGTTDRYSILWNNVPDGNYILTAIAVNNLGNEAVSTSVTIQVNPQNTAPTVSIIYPTNNTVFPIGSNISIGANAEDFDGAITKVEFFYSSTVKIGEVTSPPYEITWNNVSAGSYSITAKATDNLNAITTSQPRSISVAADTPTITTISPTSGVVGTTVTIDGSNFGNTQGSSTVTFNGVPAALAPSQALSATTALAKPADYNGDGKTDISIFRPSTYDWWWQSSFDNIQRATNWGVTGDRLVPADYDGDGKSDFAVFRPSDGVWYIINSLNNTVTYMSWGGGSDIPVPADYDGDGKADISIWRPSDGNWWIHNSNDNSLRVQQWGASTDRLVPGNYDGDLKDDIAVFRPSEGNWYIFYSSNNSYSVTSWGLSSDITVQGKYDNDNKTDIAIWRPSNGQWWVLNSLTNSSSVYTWGISSDKVVPGDYDGDGKTDYAFWRPSTQNWNIVNSSNFQIRVQTFGLSSDLPVSSTVTYDNAQPSSSNWSNTRLIVTVPQGATTGPVIVVVNNASSNSVTFTLLPFVDSDSDGMSDEWEYLYFGNLNQTANGDADGDGVSNLDEYLQGRNPTKGAVSDSTGVVNLKVYTPLINP